VPAPVIAADVLLVVEPSKLTPSVTVSVIPELMVKVPTVLVAENEIAITEVDAVTVIVAPDTITALSAAPGTTPPAHEPVAFQAPPVAVDVMIDE
jgi:hypothetical protein